ncbi:hypothetical protein CMK11_00360 [Candidatus Poribacteria bacterium]|nr:hypothetical protein [Candidatus Poribacteria bacterium]
MPRRASLVCAVATVFALAAVSSVRGLDWQQTNGPDAGEGQTVFVAASGTLLASVADTAVYRSVDGGDTWTPAAGVGPAIGHYASANGYLYAAHRGEGVYRSDDDGATWALLPNGPPKGIGSLAVSGTTVYAGSAYAGPTGTATAYRSGDDGVSWTEGSAGLPQDETYVIAMATLGASVYAAVAPGADADVCRSDDGGANWVRKTVNAATRLPAANGLVAIGSSLYFSKNDHGQSFDILRTDDGGDTWASVATGLPTTGSTAPSPVVELGGSLFVGIHQNGIYRSSDSGASWTKKSDGFFNLRVNAFAASATTVYASSVAGLHRSDDNGESWARAMGGIHKAQV